MFNIFMCYIQETTKTCTGHIKQFALLPTDKYLFIIHVVSLLIRGRLFEHSPMDTMTYITLVLRSKSAPL